ncbi:glycoside hydrolase family 2 TIM barrel-domain containing protein [Fulvivirgaceae bacterium BMA12]|uniref:Beta-glucuronidase n=1 Tax=Agaribacillus aureus TaxID=3051825 RepID=A0ABT8L699_9BACT|nr:glycoside hydrolase family 2 TIM barrel-domain containing protein [Fulvivirgaceae bacterium BMA12]
MKILKLAMLCTIVQVTALFSLDAKNNIIQNVSARKYKSLDGVWQIIIDPLENGFYNHSLKPRKNGYFKNEKIKNPDDLIEYNFDHSYQLNVPGDWNTQMEKLYYYEGCIWYKKSFDYREEINGRVYVHFEAVNYECKVYLNGQHLGDHVGGYTPFSFEVTELLQKTDNFLIVKVKNSRRREGVPTINTDWWNYGGITRSVKLLELPNLFIQDYAIRLSKNEANVIEGWVQLNGDNLSADVEVSIPELKKKINIRTNENGFATFKVKSAIERWSPENPKLYKIKLVTDRDVLEDEVGFKRIEVRGTDILLNGKPIFLKGISIHEEAPFGGGRVTTPEQCRILLNWAKELGCNFIRLAHYPHGEHMVKQAEKMGFLIWSEIPVYWTVLFNNNGTYQNAENQLEEMITRDKNRVGIGLWSVANETPVNEERLAFLKKLIAKARSLDNTRLITAALNSQKGQGNNIIIDDQLGKHVDVIGINNYCGWYSKKPGECGALSWQNKFDKPVILSEVGAGALVGLHGAVNERWTEEYQAEVYRHNLRMVENIEFVQGLSPWILTDFRSPRRNLRHIQMDYNRKGLISDSGIKKEAFYILQQYYKEKVD